VFAGLLLTMGALGDRFGRARALQVGLIIFTVSSFGATLATEVSHLIVVRIAMGVGGALIMPSTLSVIANTAVLVVRGMPARATFEHAANPGGHAAAGTGA
jgi:MFS family permease